MDPALRRLLESGSPADEVAVMVRLATSSTALPPGVRTVSRFGDIVTVRTRRDGLEALWSSTSTRSVKAPRLYRPDLVAVEAEAIVVDETDRRRDPELEPCGRGVLVGVLDWGLDIEHPAFLDASGHTRVEALWDQAAAPDPTQPNRFGYGRIHERAALNAAIRAGDPVGRLGYDHTIWDVGGGTHGTATTSIAAGSAWPGGVEGVAPQAAIVFVNLAGNDGLGHSVKIGEGIDFIRERARGRPWVVNMSLGRHGGPHDGSTLVEQLLDAAVTDAAGGIVVNSTGNYLSSRVHTSGRLGDSEVVRLPMRVDRAAEVREVDVWYRSIDEITVGIEAPNGERALARAEAEAQLTVGGVVCARIQHRAHDPNNGKNQAVIRIQPEAPEGTWYVVLGAADIVDGRFHAWIERESLSPRLQARFVPEVAVQTTTTGTICNGVHTIAVGACDARTSERPLTTFSSSGDTVDGRRKPTIVAPGERVLVARSGRRGGVASERSTRMSGTSMAAPFVAGAAACLLEVLGNVPAARVRSLLTRTADAYEGTEAIRAGSGYLDLRTAVDEARRSARPAGAEPSRGRRTSRSRAGRARTTSKQLTTEGSMSTITPGLDQTVADPEATLARLGISARGLFEIYVLSRREAERARLADQVAVLAGPGELAPDDFQPGDLLVRGVMGEGLAKASALVTGRLHDLRELVTQGLEPEGRQPGRYAWVVEGGRTPHSQTDSFARRICDRRGFLPPDQVVLRVSPTPTAAPTATPTEWLPEAVNRASQEYVRWYQDALNRIESAGLAVDGIAGQLTHAAVRRYQARKGLAADGIVGPITERALMLDGTSPPPGFDGPVPFPPFPIPPFPPLPLPPTPPAPPVAAVRTRKNITALSAAERSALVNAFLDLKRRRVYHEFVRDHAQSMTNAHRQPAFLPWHRQFLLILESELRAVDPSVTLPYWDWSHDPGRDGGGNLTWNAAMVALLGGNGTGPTDAVTTGPFASWTAVDDRGNDTALPIQRAFGQSSWARSLPSAAEVSSALRITPYDASPWDDSPTTTGFRNELEGWARANHLHNVVHGWVGGSMLPGTSPNDPCFFLHHCFIDKIWADWQATHPTETYLPATRQSRGSGSAPAWGLNDDVPVFRVTSASPVMVKAADTLDLRNLRDHRGQTGIQVRYV